MAKVTGNRVLSGTWGELWIDGQKVFEFKKVEAKVSVNREDIQMGMDVDSKMTGMKGEITITINKVYSRYETIRKNYAEGKDIRSQVITKLGDPDAVGGGQERYSIDNVWWNELPIISMEKGAIIEEELSGGFTPSDMICLDNIAVA